MSTGVLVVGAGPVGLTMACELARYGLPVRIVDRNAGRTDKSKALAVWSRTLELMDRMGCSERFVATGLKVEGASILAGKEQIGHVDMRGMATPYPFALMIPQSESERLLEEQLETFGVKVERRTELKEFVARPDGVCCRLEPADGREETVEVGWLIGCDGAHSSVRHELGIEFHGETLSSDWVLADVQLSGMTGPPEVTIAWHADGVVALFPLGGPRYRVVANTGESSGPAEPVRRAEPTMEELQEILDKRFQGGTGGGIRASDPQWLTRFSINERKVADYRAGRVFLAGDAAHVHSPAGGQGMNTGIQDACNLAWKLALVSRGIAAEQLLDSYSSERSHVAKLILEATGRATAMAVVKGELKQSIRNHVASLLFGFSPVEQMTANAVSELAIGYSGSPLTERSMRVEGGPRTGDRAPIRGDEPPVGAGDTPRFAVFAEDSEGMRGILSKYKMLVEPAVRKPFAQGLWLVRPDGYVALVARGDEWQDVDSYLGRIVSSSG